MLAGVEILLLVVPVWIWIIDWSYCRVIPKDEHTLAVNGKLLGVQIFRSFFAMMRDRKMFGEVVSFVGGTCSSTFNFELLLALTVLEPVVLHVNGFRAALLDGLVGNANSCGVVTSHWCWQLEVPHFFECDANWNCINTVVETTRHLSFSYGGYNRFDDAGVVYYGTVDVVNAEGAKPVMRAVTTACAGLNQPSRSIGGPSPPSIKVRREDCEGVFQSTATYSTDPDQISQPELLDTQPSSDSQKDSFEWDGSCERVLRGKGVAASTLYTPQNFENAFGRAVETATDRLTLASSSTSACT